MKCVTFPVIDCIIIVEDEMDPSSRSAKILRLLPKLSTSTVSFSPDRAPGICSSAESIEEPSLSGVKVIVERQEISDIQNNLFTQVPLSPSMEWPSAKENENSQCSVIPVLDNTVAMRAIEVENCESTELLSEHDDECILNFSDDSVADPDFRATSSTDESSSKSENTSEPNANRGKKRKLSIATRKKETAKRLRNMGKEYISVSKSCKVISARTMGGPCTEKCRLACFNKFSQEQRQVIFDQYWKLGNLEQQRAFIAASIEPVKPKYRYTRMENQRNFNQAFYFSIQDAKIRVCKLFFKNTLGINDRPIRTVMKKKNNGFIELESRGKHSNHFKVNPEIKHSVRRHINSIPRMESHYLRANTSREYIEGGKSLADLHRDYQQEQTNMGEPSANLMMYSRIFNEEFNISFFSPKKDLCNLCESYKNAPDDPAIKKLYDTHQEEKLLSRKSKEEDKVNITNNKSLLLASFDLQSVMPCPKGNLSIFYYKSKLNSYNFTICEIGRDAAECFFWHEGEGHRGANEIGSCILKYLEKTASSVDDDNLEITFYSDNCCGQNKNRYIISMFLFAVRSLKIKAINHKFLICGHTQNEGDAVHSVIEKEIKKSLKRGPIFIPQQYATIIRMAKKKGRPYAVHELSHTDFLDLKQLNGMIGGNYSKNMQGKTVKMTDMKIMRYEKCKPNSFQYKLSYKDLEFEEIEVKKRLLDKMVVVRPAYTKKVSIDEKKKADILELIRSKHIPQSYAAIFTAMFS